MTERATSMNPFSNRWALLFVVVLFLLLVAELVGTDKEGGVLSQMRGSQAGAVEDGSEQEVEVIGPAADEVPAEDMPQIISAEEAEEADNFQLDGEEPAAGDNSGEVEVIEAPDDDIEIIEG